jgi:mRNA-degrading endonuclease RelE of RelBE toxin-antitoxin system
MSYIIEFSSEFEKSIKKLKRKDRETFLQIQKKLLEIVETLSTINH